GHAGVVGEAVVKQVAVGAAAVLFVDGLAGLALRDLRDARGAGGPVAARVAGTIFHARRSGTAEVALVVHVVGELRRNEVGRLGIGGRCPGAGVQVGDAVDGAE